MSTGLLARWWGPVFDAEWKTRSRRWQGYALRALFVLGLLAGLFLCWSDQFESTKYVTVEEMAEVGSSAYESLVFLELIAVLIIAPAATAGAICLDKSRGSLAHVFVTDLTNREIILGKLAARLLPVVGLLACALPVLALTTLLGGVDPLALTGGFAVMIGLAVLGCSLALMLSVWASKPQEVISVVFGIWALWLLAWPVWEIGYDEVMGMPPGHGWLTWTNPFCWTHPSYVFVGGTPIREPIYFSLACMLVGAGCTAVAIRQVRVVGCRSVRPDTGRVGIVGRVVGWLRGQVRWGQGPSLDANPVGWREWHRNRPSRWLRIVWTTFGIVNALVCLGLIVTRAMGEYIMDMSEIPALLVSLLTTLGLLLVSAATSSVLADERARGSLDVLMSTPVATRTILWAKWRGAFRRVPGLAVWPTVVVVVYSSMGRPNFTELATAYLMPILIVTQGAALVSLGLALATWIKRTGQATAWTVAALVFAVVGWPIVGNLLPLTDWIGLWPAPELEVRGTIAVMRSPETLGYLVLEESLSMGSPTYNIAVTLVSGVGEVGGSRAQNQATLILVAAWTLLYALAAWGLFEATVRTFDRCLGRAPENPQRPRLAPIGDDRSRRFGLIKGWGWRIPGAAGRPAGRAASFAPRPR